MPDPTTFPRPAALLAALLLAAAPPLASQPSRAEPTTEDASTLAGRMRAFTDAMFREPLDSVARFFPRRGDWTWVVTTRREGSGRRVGAWRFPGAETLRAIREGGPVCESFDRPGDTGYLGALMNHMMDPEKEWRRVGGSRFVPPGAPARSPAFVEWRREDGVWVVSAFGDERHYQRPLLGRVRDNTVTQDKASAPLPPVGYPTGEGWYVNDEPITFDGMRYVKYGLPRALPEDEMARFGSLGRVTFYVEVGAGGHTEVLYAAVAPGRFQPYQMFGSPPCR